MQGYRINVIIQQFDKVTVSYGYAVLPVFRLGFSVSALKAIGSTISFGIPNGNRTINISEILKDYWDRILKDKKLKQFKYRNSPLY